MVLFCQISTNLINSHRNGLSTHYYQKIWEMRELDGYQKPDDFWEIPNWVAILRHNIKEADFTIVRNVDDFVRFLNASNYHYVCFSVLEANKHLIREIIEKYTGNATFALGGYIDLERYFGGYDNVATFETLKHFSALVMGRFTHGYNYSDFRNNKCIPRLTLSTGCHNRCRFCSVKKTVEVVQHDEIAQQIKSFKDLDFKLVYLNDKTFGQSRNFSQLPRFLDRVREDNDDFKGTIIQTTPRAFLRLSDNFLRDAQIKFVELGIESYNDHILGAYRKPSRTKDIDEATDRFRHIDAQLIPNIIIGFPEETKESYQETLRYIERNQDVVSHMNIYNLAIYQQAEIASKVKAEANDLNELVLEKSFHKDKEAHRWFYDEIFGLGLEILK